MTERSERNEAKSRLLGKARKLAKDIERYASYGYVTQLSAYADDDRKLSRGIDSIYDLARKHGLAEDAELQQVRMQLRERFVHVRNNEAPQSRQQLGEAQLRALDKSRKKVPSGMQGYLDELKIGEDRRRARRGG